MIRARKRSLEAAVKQDRILKAAFYQVRGLYHGARMGAARAMPTGGTTEG